MIGDWRKGPGKALFDAVDRRLGSAAPKIMAEDLGVITTDVKALRREVGAPGMVVLQFAWGGGADNTHLPHNHYANSFVYPGTHDNETAVGWYNDSATVGTLLCAVHVCVNVGIRSQYGTVPRSVDLARVSFRALGVWLTSVFLVWDVVADS